MYTVVVADDEEELRRALIRKVDWESVGFQVVGEAENGIEALELVEKLEPDLLLTDVKMPFITGIELARQVREIRPTMQIAFLSGYDDFSYAQQAIQYNIISYLLKPISSAELTEELGKIKQKIDDKFKEFASQSQEQEQMEVSAFLLPLLLDGFTEGKPEDSAVEELLRQEALKCGLLKADNPELKYTVLVSSIYEETGENKTSKANVNGINIILKKYVRHVSFYAQGKIISYLIATQAGFDKYLHIIVEDIIQSVKRVMNLNCVVGVSRAVEGLSESHEAYVEAMNALHYSSRVDADVHFITDVERAESVDQEMVQNAANEIEILLRSGSQDELESFLKTLFGELERKGASATKVYFLLVQLVSSVFRTVYAVTDGEAVKELQQLSPLQGQFFTDNLTDICKRYMKFCLVARSLIAEQRKKSSSVICDKALQMIEDNYMDQELSLVSISTEIAVSPNYLSALIKKSTGSTFVDLLTKKRIETAKELLQCTAMKIKEISEKCGYNDQHYFSYCFKKYTGISPNACRQLNGQDQ